MDLYETLFQSFTPAQQLLHAVSCNLSDRLQTLIASGAGVNDSLYQQNGNCATHVAALKGHDDCLRLLLRAGANPDQLNDFGMTPIILALRHGNVKCVKLLLSTGSRMSDPMMTWLSQQYSTGTSIWHAYSPEMIKLLLIATPNIHEIGSGNLNQLYESHMKSGQNTELIKVYCLCGINFDSQQMAHFLANVDEDLAAWLRERHKVVHPLQHYARLAIRRQLKPNVIFGGKLLPLPAKVQDYLLFEDCV